MSVWLWIHKEVKLKTQANIWLVRMKNTARQLRITDLQVGIRTWGIPNDILNTLKHSCNHINHTLPHSETLHLIMQSIYMFRIILGMNNGYFTR
jgi:hypothetical protein